MATTADYAVTSYENNIEVFTQDPTPIPLSIPLSRIEIIQRLHRAQVAEIRDPEPDDLLDSGEESRLD